MNQKENPKCQTLARGAGGSSFWLGWEVGASLALGSTSWVLTSASFALAAASLSSAASLVSTECFPFDLTFVLLPFSPLALITSLAESFRSFRKREGTWNSQRPLGRFWSRGRRRGDGIGEQGQEERRWHRGLHGYPDVSIYSRVAFKQSLQGLLQR